MTDAKTRVLIVRGRHVTSWGLLAWEALPARFDVAYLLTRRNSFAVGDVRLDAVRARAFRDLLPRGRLGDLLMGVTGDRYLDAGPALERADVVHTEELSFWFAAQVARLKPRYRYRLVVTVWETLPLVDAYRNRLARVYRREILAAADRFLAASERARDALLLEGVEPDRVEVCYPGVDVERFGDVARADPPPREHVVISPGRLVWEKGHQDVMRALAAIRAGIVPRPEGARPRLLVVGSGPEETRLKAYARELGIGDAVEVRSVPYTEMPATYAQATCMVLASLSNAGCPYFLGDIPRCFWEEQFGLVLAESMAAGLPILSSTSGAIPEVCGDSAEYFAPGDWKQLAAKLAAGPLARPPAARVQHDPERVRRYSTEAAADRLAAAYDRLLASATARS